MFDEDMSVFFDSQDGFAVEANVAGVTVSGIFDSSYYDGGDVATQIKALILPDSVVPAGAVRGASVAIGAKNYVIRNPEPGNNGLTTLVLE